jgi:FAD/FMN-containing dehydrogenase/Fe-S oxidoreductase
VTTIEVPPDAMAFPPPARAGAPGTRVDAAGLDESARLLLAADLQAAVRGEVAFDGATRGVYATDSSNYRQVPLGVVFPMDEADVLAVVGIAAAHDAPIVSRGGGTALAGQSCNVAVVLDFSRHMTAILDLDPVRRIARVQPGIVLDDLRAAAEVHGLTFGPDPATHAWCTLGGMVGNNSCGTHALYAGKTVDNIERLRMVTYAGTVLDLGPVDDAEYSRLTALGGETARIHSGMREIGRRYADLVAERFPDIPRRVSGYNLDELTPERGWNTARALVGTEGTCGIVTEITVTLTNSPTHRRMVVLGYPDIFLAADAVPSLLTHPLLGLEGMDDVLIGQMREIDLNTASLPLLPPGKGWLIAELGDDDPAVADANTDAFIAAIPAGVHHVRYDAPLDQRRIWTIRESGLGATAVPPNKPHNHEGWEDAGVPPARLGEYLRRISALWADYGYYGSWYGHFGQGCVHTRNPFDLHTVEGLADYREFVERAARICVELGGSISGEHGDGQARGELLTIMFGPELVDAFRQFKAVWDPRGKMNPGKVVDPYPLDTNIRFGPEYRRDLLTDPSYFAYTVDGGSLQRAAEHCVGVGRCRRDDTGVMCPSYRVTRDERHSTRGRAKLLVEMFQGETTAADWRNTDVKAALDLCLSCKGCQTDCPTHVDMATYKAEFLAHHYKGRLRPRESYALGLIPLAARMATAVPGLANAVLSAPGLSTLFRRLGGVTTERPAPRFAPTSLRRAAGTKARAATADATVVVWPDTFTDAWSPRHGVATVKVLEAAGETVAVPTEWACCGRPLYDHGMLDLAKTWLRRLLDVLDPWIAAGVPIVVPEPSCLAAFRDELPQLLRDDPRAAKLAGLARSLAEHLEAIDWEPPAVSADAEPPGRIVVHPHCQSRAVVGTTADRAVLERAGYDVEILDAGCCGLAGSFGFTAGEHAELSKKIADETWLPRLWAAAAGTTDPGTSGVQRGGQPATVLADGFSCVTQAAQLGGPATSTLAELLHRRIQAATDSGPNNASGADMKRAVRG